MGEGSSSDGIPALTADYASVPGGRVEYTHGVGCNSTSVYVNYVCAINVRY